MSASSNRLLNVFTGIIAGCAVVMTAVSVRSRLKSDEHIVVQQAAGQDKPVAGWDSLVAVGRRVGPTTAQVVILEFADFECPFCARHVEVLKQVLKKYPDDVAVVFRHWPLQNHKFAMPAALASECAAAQGKFEAYHDILFANQDSIGLLSFEDFAQRVGVGDIPKFTRCRTTDAAAKARIERDARTVVALGGHGTPTVIVNGVMYDRPPALDKLEQIISDALRGKTRED